MTSEVSWTAVDSVGVLIGGDDPSSETWYVVPGSSVGDCRLRAHCFAILTKEATFARVSEFFLLHSNFSQSILFTGASIFFTVLHKS